METMVDRLLDIAEELVRQNPRSSTAKRRAVSNAYYAAFHALARTCADTLMPVDRTDDRYERVYRSLEHGAIKQAFLKGSPLRTQPALSAIGELMIALRSERFRADYLPPKPNVFTRARSEELISQSRAVVSLLLALPQEERRSLAAHLLFKDVRQ